MRKDHLYQYGGRPVIYNDEDLFRKLDPDSQYLWVKYDPNPKSFYGDYPFDFTHEREWRCRHRKYQYHMFDGLWNIDDGVPILLPGDNKDIPDFKILVKEKWDGSIFIH